MDVEKKNSEAIKWNGVVTLIRQNATTGEIIEQRKVHNTVTNYALGAIALLIANSATNQISAPAADYIKLGTGTGTTSPDETKLIGTTPILSKQCAYVVQYQNTCVQYSATWQTSDTPLGKWTEAGLFDVSGNLWAHTMLGNFIVNTGEVLTVQWLIQLMGE